MLNQTQDSQPADAITFTLTTRLMISGNIAIVLQLFRGDLLTRTSTLMVCERHKASPLLQTCRLHLCKLGIAEGGGPRPRTMIDTPEPRPFVWPDRPKPSLRLPLAASL